MEKIKAPFSPAMVETLRLWQTSLHGTPVCCPHAQDTPHQIYASYTSSTAGSLEVNEAGYTCPVCSFKQEWAPSSILTTPTSDPQFDGGTFQESTDEL
jgi:hypothetical protein